MSELEQYYPADRQPRTLTSRLVELGRYSSAQSARKVLSREGLETITLDLSGIWTDPETGEKVHVVVRGVRVERTPGRLLENPQQWKLGDRVGVDCVDVGVPGEVVDVDDRQDPTDYKIQIESYKEYGLPKYVWRSEDEVYPL